MNISNFEPIGLLDSGVGGLAVLKELIKKAPTENYIYLADNLNMPYGNKSVRFVKNRILELVNYLYDTFHVKLVIIACNTASITALEYVQKHSPVKVIGLEPLKLVGDNTIMLCTKLSSKGCGNNVIACNKLASIIEDNIFDSATLKHKMQVTLNKLNIDKHNIILGCTHYELVETLFKQILPNNNFILPGKEFVNSLNLTNQSNAIKGSMLMLATKPTKSYIDKLWKLLKSN